MLEFDNLTRLRCFDVEIIEDSIFEGDEQFTVQLTVDAVNFNGAPQSISLPNATATITIVEISTLLLVGFEEESLNRRVPQNGETISLCVVVVGSREITANFSVSVAFNGGTAGEWVALILHTCGLLWVSEGTKELTDGQLAVGYQICYAVIAIICLAD